MYEALLREGIGSEEDAEAFEAALEDDGEVAEVTDPLQKAALMIEWGGEAEVV